MYRLGMIYRCNKCLSSKIQYIQYACKEVKLINPYFICLDCSNIEFTKEVKSKKHINTKSIIYNKITIRKFKAKGELI